MIDSHCHLNLAPLGNNVSETLQLAKQNGVERIMVPGITPASWEVLSQYNRQPYGDILPIDTAIGLHPYFLPNDLNEILPLLKLFEKAVAAAVTAANGYSFNAQGCFSAIGETGLDSHIAVSMDIQKRVLHAHLDIADSFGLPVILHHRKSHHLLLEALKTSAFNGRGVIHAFSGSIDVANCYIDRGFCLGVGGTITYKRAKKTRDTVAHLLRYHPDSILLETDAPDMPMSGRQGLPNMPHYLKDVVSSLAALSGIPPNEIVTMTSINYARLFKSFPF